MVSRHVGVVIAATKEAVYAYARDPEHLPRWAGGLAQAEVERAEDDSLTVASPMGDVTVVFAPHNDYGVLDHDVTLPDGSVTNNPLRVLVHPEGAEVVFTVRQGAASDEDFARDTATVQADLERLKALLEGRQVGNLLNLSTPLGIALARAGRARVRRGPHGLLLAEGVRLPFPDAGALTIGNIVLSAGRFGDLVARLPRVLEHESRHASQWLRWGGLPFLPAYLIGAGWSLLRTGDRAARNPFERAAGLADGGYRDVPVRRIRRTRARPTRRPAPGSPDPQ